MNQLVKQRKNQYVDVLKGIACIIVIFLHCPLPGVIGDGIIYGLRFSVPVFFMISGYYSYAKNDEWIRAKAKYILKLLLVAELFYGVWLVVKECVIQQKELQDVLLTTFETKNILVIILCGTFFNGTLWYLYAIFWTWMIVYLLRKLGLVKKVYILIPILLIVQIFGRAYVQNVYDINKYVFLFRNALTFGLPFALLGTWIAENKANILEKLSVRNNLLMIISGFCLIVVEFLTFGQYMDTHISTVIISVGLFIYAIRPHEIKRNFPQVFTWIGNRWYTWIYISHMFFVELLGMIYKSFHVEDSIVLQFILPFLVCILASICSELIVRVKK